MTRGKVASRIDLVRSRKGFYRGNYNRVCIGLLIALVIIFLLTGLVVYLTIFRPVSDFYATSMDGKITRLVSLDSPMRASA
ncbi:MAG: type IV secretion protein IcmL [Pseudomonadota bacterium]